MASSIKRKGYAAGLNGVDALPYVVVCRENLWSTNAYHCGYVGVGREHPLFGKEYDEVHSIKVHGGLTYSDKDIRGVTLSGFDTDNLWWFGFDTAHGFETSFTQSERVVMYVEKECFKLAEQLIKLT